MNEQEKILLRAIQHGIMVNFHKVDQEEYPEAHKAQEHILSAINGIEEECRNIAQDRFDQLGLEMEFDPYNLALNPPIKLIKIVGIFPLSEMMKVVDISSNFLFEKDFNKRINGRRLDDISLNDQKWYENHAYEWANNINKEFNKTISQLERSIVIFETEYSPERDSEHQIAFCRDLESFVSFDHQCPNLVCHIIEENLLKDKCGDSIVGNVLVFNHWSENHLRLARFYKGDTLEYRISRSDRGYDSPIHLAFLV